jgi:hypothetical protein
MQEIKTKMIFQDIMIKVMGVLLNTVKKHPNDYIIGYPDGLVNDIRKCEAEIKRLNGLIRVEKINKLLSLT